MNIWYGWSPNPWLRLFWIYDMDEVPPPDYAYSEYMIWMKSHPLTTPILNIWYGWGAPPLTMPIMCTLMSSAKQRGGGITLPWVYFHGRLPSYLSKCSLRKIYILLHFILNYTKCSVFMYKLGQNIGVTKDMELQILWNVEEIM